MKKTERFNISEHGSYAPLPELSPYSTLSKKRLQNPKFIFRKCLEIAKSKGIEDRNYFSWADIGCANGEFIHYLRNNTQNNAQFTGIEITKDFLSVAKLLFEGDKNVSLISGDFLELTVGVDLAKHDVFSCLGSFPIFPEPHQFLHKALDLTAPGGLLLIDGRFNPYDIDIIIKYKDDSSVAKGLWRCDFNVHSEKTIRHILDGRNDVLACEFHYFKIDVDIPKQQCAPHVNMWTEIDSNGKRIVTNGMLQNFDPSFLVIEKT